MKRKILNWFKRNWKWALPVLVLVGTVNVILFSTFFKSTSIYKDSLEIVMADSRIKESLGEPLSPGFLALGQIASGEGSVAFVNYHLKGSGQSGQVSVRARKIDGAWFLEKIDVYSDIGDKFSWQRDDNGDWFRYKILKSN